MTFLPLKSLGFFSPALQIIFVCVLFVILTLIQHRESRRTGKMYTHYPIHISILFVPIYEEIIFRGLIFGGLLTIYSTITAVVVSSLLFGLWHFKNIFYLSKRELASQILYTTIFGAVMAYITLLTGTIWLAVILHYLNNIIAPYSQRLFKMSSK